jgi:transposase
LLPDFLLERRLDEVEVIGRGLALHVTGVSMRNVAEHLAVPMTTAREWQRRFQVRAPTLAATFVAFAVHLDPAAVLLAAANGEAVALEALGVAWLRARTLWRPRAGGLAILEPDQRRPGAGCQQKPARDGASGSRLDGAIALKEVRMSSDPREATALFRYRIVAEATNPRLTPAERGQLVRELASRAYDHPDGSGWTYSRGTLDRWLRAYRDHGLDGLLPPPRSDLGVVRRHPQLLEEACQLRRELPGRSATQISAILKAQHGVVLPDRTIRQHLRRQGLHRAAIAGQPRVFGRFEAERPNERRIGDVVIGPFVPHPRAQGSRRAHLFLLVDDFSRLLVHCRWVPDQNTRAGQEVLRAAIQRRGLPEQLYVDNGAPYANAALERSCRCAGDSADS